MNTIPLSDTMQAAPTRAVFTALEARGGKGCVRFVGGCVRNVLMGKPVSDLDLATTLTPDETEAALATAGIKSVPTGKMFGTITAVLGSEIFEITSLREDVETDGRRAVVKFTTDWAKDAERRDFYLNALYADIDGQVYDPTGFGLEDAQTGRVRFIGEAEQRIREDYLRILRFFRFTAGYGAGIDEASLAACAGLKDGIDGLSGERIQQELFKILKLPNPLPAFEAMQRAGVMPHIIPGWHGVNLSELAAMIRFSDEVEHRLLAVFDCGLGLEGEKLDVVRARWNASPKLMERLVAAGQVAAQLADIDEPRLKRLVYTHGRPAMIDAVYLIAAHLNRSPAGLLGHIEALIVPVFPIKGADLIKRGMIAGPEVGKRLKQIETEWLEHDFSQSVIDRALDATAK